MNTVETIASGAREFSQPMVLMLGQMADFVPLLLGSVLVLVFGLIIAPLLGNLARKAMEILKADRGMDLSGAKDAFSSIGLNFTLSRVVGETVKYLVLIVFIVNAANIIGLGQLSDLINSLIQFIPQVIVALVLIGVGLTAADWLRDIVENIAHSSDNADYAGLLGSITRISVIVFSVMAALIQVGIGSPLIEIIFAGIVFTFALAFGLGSKDIVADALQGWLKK